MSEKVFCKGCKHRIHYIDMFPQDRCAINYEMRGNAIEQWKSYSPCETVNSKNDCQKREPDLFERFFKGTK